MISVTEKTRPVRVSGPCFPRLSDPSLKAGEKKVGLDIIHCSGKKEMRKQRMPVLLILLSYFIIFGFMPSMSLALADGHKEIKKHFENHGSKKVGKGWGGLIGGKNDDGNETTGQIAAWSLAVANLPVAISLLIRGIRRFARLRPQINDSLTNFNSLQKKHLMKLHYILNPAILAVALLHWMLSMCKSTALPELAVATMSIIIALGIILKLKLCPKSYLRTVYKIHTQPLAFLLMISILLVGHLSMD